MNIPLNLKTMDPVDLARGLMGGEKETLKAGYTADNAVLAVAQMQGLDLDAALALSAKVGGNENVIRACLA
jgi:hypothetical protein